MTFYSLKKPKDTKVWIPVVSSLFMVLLIGCAGQDSGERVKQKERQAGKYATLSSSGVSIPPIGYPGTKGTVEGLSPLLKEIHRTLAAKPGPNLVKSYDIGPATDYNQDCSWHFLRKEKVTPLANFGCVGVINPNSELQYMMGFAQNDGEFEFRPPGKTVLHGVDFLCEEIKLDEELKASVTFLPYDSTTLMSFVEFENSGSNARDVTVCQRLEKEVFDRISQTGPNRGQTQFMPGVIVPTGVLKDATHTAEASIAVYPEWELVTTGMTELGSLLAYMGGDKVGDGARHENPPFPEPRDPQNPTVRHVVERIYNVEIPAGGSGRLALFLSLQKFTGKGGVYFPRGVRPFLFGKWDVALEKTKGSVTGAFGFDWSGSLKARLDAYGKYPLVDLPDKKWNSYFLACLELPRGETYSPQQFMKVPFYNFCRFYGNELRRWWSYGMHAHESLSTFVTAMTDPKLASDHLTGHFINQDPDGAFPYGVSMISKPGSRTFQAAAVTAPWIAWEAWNVYLWSKDQEFLTEAFKRCEKDYRYWMDNRDRTGEGLCFWLDFGETVRDDGTVPTWRYEGAPVIYQEALDLNCYLLNVESTLADMAKELGRDDKASMYRAAWESRARAINAYMWDEGDKCYYGRSEISDVYVKVKDIGTLMPLWCGVAPTERAQSIVDLLHDPKHFASAWPIPVLSLSDPKYMGGDNTHWHGGNWVEMSWLIARGLRDYGRYGEAADLAYRNVLMVFQEYERSSHLREYFHAETGKGLSLFDYIWAAMPASYISDVFFGIKPSRDGVAIVPSLPKEWPTISIRNLHIRNKVLDITVRRDAVAGETAATVNGAPRQQIVEGRGIRIGWDEFESTAEPNISIEIVQPNEIVEKYAPPQELPANVLNPLPAHAKVETTTEELQFQAPFIHYESRAVPWIRPATLWKKKK